MSAITTHGWLFTMVRDESLTSVESVRFLKHLLAQLDRQLLVIWDGSPIHRGKEVKAYLADGATKHIHLEALPPYAPDLNPDEFVWSYMKNNGVSKKPLKKNESLRRRVEEDLNKIQGDKELVRSFFRAESVAYASD